MDKKLVSAAKTLYLIACGAGVGMWVVQVAGTLLSSWDPSNQDQAVGMAAGAAITGVGKVLSLGVVKFGFPFWR